MPLHTRIDVPSSRARVQRAARAPKPADVPRGARQTTTAKPASTGASSARCTCKRDGSGHPGRRTAARAVQDLGRRFHREPRLRRRRRSGFRSRGRTRGTVTTRRPASSGMIHDSPDGADIAEWQLGVADGRRVYLELDPPAPFDELWPDVGRQLFRIPTRDGAAHRRCWRRWVGSSSPSTPTLTGRRYSSGSLAAGATPRRATEVDAVVAVVTTFAGLGDTWHARVAHRLGGALAHRAYPTRARKTAGLDVGDLNVFERSAAAPTAADVPADPGRQSRRPDGPDRNGPDPQRSRRHPARAAAPRACDAKEGSRRMLFHDRSARHRARSGQPGGTTGGVELLGAFEEQPAAPPARDVTHRGQGAATGLPCPERSRRQPRRGLPALYDPDVRPHRQKLEVSIDIGRRYPVAVAMTLAGFILYASDWATPFRRIGSSGSSRRWRRRRRDREAVRRGHRAGAARRWTGRPRSGKRCRAE